MNLITSIDPKPAYRQWHPSVYIAHTNTTTDNNRILTPSDDVPSTSFLWIAYYPHGCTHHYNPLYQGIHGASPLDRRIHSFTISPKNPHNYLLIHFANHPLVFPNTLWLQFINGISSPPWSIYHLCSFPSHQPLGKLTIWSYPLSMTPMSPNHPCRNTLHGIYSFDTYLLICNNSPYYFIHL